MTENTTEKQKQKLNPQNVHFWAWCPIWNIAFATVLICCLLVKIQAVLISFTTQDQHNINKSFHANFILMWKVNKKQTQKIRWFSLRGKSFDFQAIYLCNNNKKNRNLLHSSSTMENNSPVYLLYFW